MKDEHAEFWDDKEAEYLRLYPERLTDDAPWLRIAMAIAVAIAAALLI